MTIKAQLGPAGVVCPTPHKEPFGSKAAAKRRSRTGRKFLRPYCCPCGSWHLTARRHRFPYPKASNR